MDPGAEAHKGVSILYRPIFMILYPPIFMYQRTDRAKCFLAEETITPEQRKTVSPWRRVGAHNSPFTKISAYTKEASSSYASY